MFFTQELLEKRESGFGLLWLAATLGAKSNFKKLPKRSVLTADISQLCGLIAEPAEPLALRLSSNLMIGVARVYKVKQEIFYSDLTTCFNSLKKAVQEFHSLAKGAGELQMGQPSMRPEALTLVADAGLAFAMDFGNVFGEWDENSRVIAEQQGVESDEFDPSDQGKKKQKTKQRPPSSLDRARGNKHTLEEHHEHLLPGSLDVSFNGDPFGAVVPSSSQFDGGIGLGFSDNVFGLPDGMDVEGGEIGDELAKELGEGWGGSPDKRGNRLSSHIDSDPFAFDPNEGGPEMDFHFDPQVPQQNPLSSRAGSELGQDPYAREGSIVVPLMPFSPIQGGDADMEAHPAETPMGEAQEKSQKKAKRVRLLLDARTELTDEELKAARANYLEGQDLLRREMTQKKFEKESGKLIEEMIWGAPHGLQSTVLVDFWLEHFKLQVEAHTGRIRLEPCRQPPTKRRKVGESRADEEHNDIDPIGGQGMDVDVDFAMGGGDYNYIPQTPDHHNANWDPDSRHRSSEDFEQARRASRPPSAIGSQFDVGILGQDFPSGSQRSALFPWDNAGAGPSSSVNGGSFILGRGSSARKSVGIADTRLRSGSLSSRRESPLVPGRPIESPVFGNRNTPLEEFEYDVPEEDPALAESQEDANMLTLERNSYNFLEYAKMQLKTFPGQTSTLSFDDVVPKMTSTPHVAAAGFYHCLVLATKDLISVAQHEAYGKLRITVK